MSLACCCGHCGPRSHAIRWTIDRTQSLATGVNWAVHMLNDWASSRGGEIDPASLWFETFDHGRQLGVTALLRTSR